MKEKHHLPPWLERIEKFVDESIPYMLVLLAVIIAVEFFHLADAYHKYIVLADYFIITFFVVDLCFKWYHTRKVVKFVKLYWIDIIAVFPFYTIFRLYAIAAEVIATGETFQKFLHEAVLLREARFARELRILREAEESAKFAREGRLVRVFARGLRLLRARWYVVHHHFRKLSEGYRSEHRNN